jgi:transposase
MEHVAIDLGSRQSQVCIRDAQGQILMERRQRTDLLGTLLSRRGPSRVVLETCSEAFAVADAAMAAGHEVRVVPATLVRSLGVGQRGVKTDQRDAQVLSEVSCRIDLPSVHIPKAHSREMRSICTSREALIAARTQLINSVRSYLRTHLGRIRRGSTATLPERVRHRAASSPALLPAHIEALLQTIETVTTQIRALDKQVNELALSNPTCKRLMTIPGVGPVTAVRFVAAVEHIGRFETSADLASYLGLAPGENSSGNRRRRTGITKAGSSAVRRVLVQAAWVFWRCRTDNPMGRWVTQLAARRGKHIAVVALARKMVRVMYAIWRDGSVYDPRQGAPNPPSA